MHNRHPNQVRSACERCRRQKLRCSRQSASPSSTSSSYSLDEPCARCARLGVSCQQGLQRKVGRPTRKDAHGAASSRVETVEDGESRGLNPIATPSTTLPEDAITVPTIDDEFILDQTDLSCDFQWAPSDTYVDVDPALSLLDMDLFRPMTLDSQLAIPDPKAWTPTSISALTSQFAALSKVNVELHTVWMALSTAAPGQITLSSLIECGPLDCEKQTDQQLSNIRENLVIRILDALKSYLDTLKALDRRLGQAALGRPCRPVLDSPTAYLVISCLTHFVRCLEIALGVVETSLSDFSAPFLLTSGTEVDDDVQGFYTSGVFYTEHLRHQMVQMFGLLGVPVPSHERRPGKTALGRVGLLAETRCRKLVNEEMGVVTSEYGEEWTARPAGLFGKLDACKDLFLERYQDIS
jgi:hypothetical protein